MLTGSTLGVGHAIWVSLADGGYIGVDSFGVAQITGTSNKSLVFGREGFVDGTTVVDDAWKVGGIGVFGFKVRGDATLATTNKADITFNTLADATGVALTPTIASGSLIFKAGAKLDASVWTVATGGLTFAGDLDATGALDGTAIGGDIDFSGAGKVTLAGHATLTSATGTVVLVTKLKRQVHLTCF